MPSALYAEGQHSKRLVEFSSGTHTSISCLLLLEHGLKLCDFSVVYQPSCCPYHSPQAFFICCLIAWDQLRQKELRLPCKGTCACESFVRSKAAERCSCKLQWAGNGCEDGDPAPAAVLQQLHAPGPQHQLAQTAWLQLQLLQGCQELTGTPLQGCLGAILLPQAPAAPAASKIKGHCVSTLSS